MIKKGNEYLKRTETREGATPLPTDSAEFQTLISATQEYDKAHLKAMENPKYAAAYHAKKSVKGIVMSDDKEISAFTTKIQYWANKKNN